MGIGEVLALGIDSLLDYPSVWPLFFLPLFLVFVFVRLPWRAWLVRLSIGRTELAAVVGLFCVGLFVYTAGTYLFTPAFWDPFESREASVAALWTRGGSVYHDLSSEERYCAPYGPALSLMLGGSQWLFGPSIVSTKLPGVVAAFVSLSLFWTMTRRQLLSARGAWALTGLLATLMLAFRQLSFWSKPDPFILLAVVAGLFAALRPGVGWQVLVGCCAGWAVDLKPHALAYFLPVAIIGFQQGWRLRAFLICAESAILVAAAPFVLAAKQFSLTNYLGFLHLTLREGSGLQETLGFCRWLLLLLILVGLGSRLTHHARLLTPGERQAWQLYQGALLSTAALITVPACSVGAGQPHLLPLLPSVLLSLGDRFITGVPVQWRPAPGRLWQALACAGALACVLIAVQTAGRMHVFHQENGGLAQRCLADVHRLLARYQGMTVLTGVGMELDTQASGLRHEAVFIGHPIGLDAAAMMDYQRSGAPEPNLDRLVSELEARTHRRVLWLIPRGSPPFSYLNWYDTTQRVYSDAFRRDFHAGFERREQSEFYDVYLPHAGSPRPPGVSPPLTGGARSSGRAELVECTLASTPR